VDRGVVELLTLEGELVQRLTPAEDLSAWGDSLGPADLAGDAYDPGDAPPMPQGTLVPELAELVDTRWVPAAMPRTAFSRQTPFVTFSGDGRWEGADGCIGVGGSWSMNPADGDWLAISSPSSDIGCDNVEVASMVGAARSVGIDPEGQLVFFDEQGGMTGEFVQAGR
jgi:hypothetical protein